MKPSYFIIVVMFVFSIFLSGCNNQTKQSSTQDDTSTDTIGQQETNKLKIYTTLYPLEFFTKKIGAEYVEVENIIPPGADAHTYEPTSKQMVHIAQAEAFIFNGLGMESFSEKIAESLKNENVLMVEATKGIETIEHSHDADEHGDESNLQHDEENHAHESEVHPDEDEHEHEGESHLDEDEHGHEHDSHLNEDEHGHEHGDLDPHIWLDPYRSVTLAENIKNALVNLKPEATEEFEKNFESLKNELEELDLEFHQLFESKKNRDIIVAHAAYGYWEESYGLKQIAVTGLSPTNEPSQRKLEEIIQIANEKNIKYVIFEQNVTPRVAEIIRKEIKAEPLQLHNLSTLTDEDISTEENYFTIMRKNLQTLDQALQ